MSVLLTKFDYAPFNQIKNSDYISSIEIAIKELKSEIDLIIDNKNKATFENTIEALDYTGIKLDRITSIFFNLISFSKLKVFNKSFSSKKIFFFFKL